MGEIADSIIDGEFDEHTGEYIGPGCGYPRSLHYDKTNNPTKGVTNYLMTQGQLTRKQKREIVKKYSEEKLGLKFDGIGFDKCCIEIQKNFGAFAQFVKQNKL